MKIIIVILFGFITLNLTAQNKEFNAGIYGGLVASQLDGDTKMGYNKPGIVIGSFVNRFVSKKLVSQLGLRYIQKGSKFLDEDSGDYYKCNLNYVELPISLRYFHFKKVDFEGGLTFGYLIIAKEDTDGYGLVEAFPEFKSFELGSLFGLSYHFNEKISAGIHLMYSITAVRPYSSGYERSIDKGQHNNLLTFTLAYNMMQK